MKHQQCFGPFPASYDEIANQERRAVPIWVMQNCPPNTMRPFHLTISQEIGNDDKEFVFKAMKPDPRDRPSAQVLLEDGTSIEKPTASASVAFFFLFMVIFGASVDCILWVYWPEILPLHVRAKGQAIGISPNWLWNFFVVMILENFAWKGYPIFMCSNLAFVPIVYFFYAETANLTLEEINFLFTDRARHPSLRAHVNAGGDGGDGGDRVDARKEIGSRSTSPMEMREDHVKEQD